MAYGFVLQKNAQLIVGAEGCNAWYLKTASDTANLSLPSGTQVCVIEGTEREAVVEVKSGEHAGELVRVTYIYFNNFQPV